MEHDKVVGDMLMVIYFNSRMQTRSAVSGAHVLLQSAEASLPKQKKNLVVAEFKQAMVAHKRRCKASREEKGEFFIALQNDFVSYCIVLTINQMVYKIIS